LRAGRTGQVKALGPDDQEDLSPARRRGAGGDDRPGERLKTDEELFASCRERDARAWESLVLRYQDRMLGLAYQFCGRRDEARDLAQEIFIRLYQNMDHFQSGRSFRPWLYSVARNCCVDHYRKRRRERTRPNEPLTEAHQLPSGAEPPDQRLQRKEREATLFRALDSLGTVSREAIVMKDLQECSLEEMTEILGVPLGTVKSRLARARCDLGKAILRLERAGARRGAPDAL